MFSFTELVRLRGDFILIVADILLYDLVVCSLLLLLLRLGESKSMLVWQGTGGACFYQGKSGICCESVLATLTLVYQVPEEGNDIKKMSFKFLFFFKEKKNRGSWLLKKQKKG